jgi:hypothetical protein
MPNDNSNNNTFTDENPPADNDYSPAALKYRAALEARQQTPDETENTTNHEQHGGEHLAKADEEKGDDDLRPAPRHFD